MRDAAHVRLSGRKTSEARGNSGHRPSAVSVELPPAPRRHGTISSVVRWFLPHRQERSHDSMDVMPTQTSTAPRYTDAQPPGPSYQQHAVPAVESASIPPPNLLVAHPLAIADAGDTAARINQFLSQKSEPRLSLTSSNAAFSSPRQLREETWYDREVSLLSHDEGDSESERVAVSSIRSSDSTWRRPRSIGGLSELKHRSSPSRVKLQRSRRNIPLLTESKLQRTVSQEDIGITAYQSRSSGEPFATQEILTLRTSTSYPKRPRDSMASIHKEQPSKIGESEAARLRKTFDFDSLLDSMTAPSQNTIQGLAERMATYEVKQMDLEYSISKLQSWVSPDRPVAYRIPTAYPLAATEAVEQSQDQISQAAKSSPQTPPVLPETSASESTSPVKPLVNYPAARSSISTIRAFGPVPSPPASREGEPSPSVVVRTSAQPGNSNRESVTLMTADHYNSLVKILQRQQSSHTLLAEQVAQLRSEKDMLAEQLQLEVKARQRQEERLQRLEAQIIAMGTSLQSQEPRTEVGASKSYPTSSATDPADPRHNSSYMRDLRPVPSVELTQSFSESDSVSGSEGGGTKRLQPIYSGDRAVPPARRPSPASSTGTSSVGIQNDYSSQVDAEGSERAASPDDDIPTGRATPSG